ncbi:universal stress protein [Neobacillus sp. PS3-40]|uniref:universal stress protein n=1 Tax=Neobacillus sp. PS3-40 TaxID=3070679 RepID=UPI0027E188BC|nr:universal stress protein [Neobacillus sp. PS3-40]WML43207.1 universal stress protein [Neobacillus sp. PS3-40]
MYKKILLASDGSEHSKRAAENAILIVKCSSNSKIVILYVVDPEKSKSDVLSNWNSFGIADIRRERIKEVESLIKKSGISYEVEFLHGEPGPVIVDYANKNHFDAVVIGSRGLNALQEFVLGSVSHKVAKHANCPVMIVK